MKEMFWCVEYVASFIEVFMCTYFCGTFILKNEISGVKGRVVNLSLIGAGIIILLNRIELFSYINTIIFLFLDIIIQWLCYRKKYLVSIGLVSVYVVVVSAIDFMVLYFIALVMNADTGHILGEQSFIRFVGILLSKSILIIVVATLNRIISHRNSIPTVYIMVMGMSSIFLLLSNMVLVHSELNLSNEKINSFTIVFFIASLGMEMIVFFLVMKIAEGYEQKQTNLLIELNNKMLQKSLDETEQTFELWRQSIHDYKNHMLALRQMAEDGKLEEIKSYLDKENELLEQKMFYVKTGNSVVDTIINTKQNTAEKHHIIFVVHADIPSNMVVSDMDMANILGNLIDNAIEASRKEEEPYIDITIKQEKNFFIMKIRNKCTKVLEIGHGKTSKENTAFHGIGLKSVKKTVKKYDGEISFGQKNQEYAVSIVIQNKNNEKMLAM